VKKGNNSLRESTSSTTLVPSQPIPTRSGLERRPTQTDRIVALLRERSPNWVPLTEILGLRISQYAARIYQARHEWGLNIENRVETVNGKKHSWFRLVEQTVGPRQSEVCEIRNQNPVESLFRDIAAESGYPD